MPRAIDHGDEWQALDEFLTYVRADDAARTCSRAPCKGMTSKIYKLAYEIALQTAATGNPVAALLVDFVRSDGAQVNVMPAVLRSVVKATRSEDALDEIRFQLALILPKNPTYKLFGTKSLVLLANWYKLVSIKAEEELLVRAERV
jgi:hypothetical protein